MSFIKIEMYTVKCDNCHDEFQTNDYSCFTDKQLSWEQAEHWTWTEHEGNHYCDECWDYGDEDEIIINTSRTK